MAHEYEIPTDAPVLVTGATGYIAGPLVQRLLEAGATVHATVRDASRTDRLQYLQDVADASPGTLRFFSADLLTPGSFHEAMAGCVAVFHVASPYQLTVTDPQRELIDPAVDGTVNVLDAVNATPSVERVVVTSSCAAVAGASADLAAAPRGVFDEDVWNTSSTLENGAYSLSKTLAERKAWEMAEAQDRWRLTTVNPPMVMGPGLQLHKDSETYAIFKQFIDGSSPAYPDLRIGMVDVRDLAEAHLRCAFLPDANGRHIICADNNFVEHIIGTLRAADLGVKLPRMKAPKPVLWLLGPMFGLTREFVAENVGHDWRADNTKSVEQLGMTYRPPSVTVLEFAQQYIDAGAVRA